jgi:hypothetical protein
MLGSQLIKLMGGGNSGITLTDSAVFGTTSAHFTLGGDGFVYLAYGSGAPVKGYAWINPQVGMDLFEVKATVLSGNLPSGTIGSWVNTGSSHTWGFSSTSEKECDLGLEIRRVSDSVVVGSATINISVSGTQ